LDLEALLVLFENLLMLRLRDRLLVLRDLVRDALSLLLELCERLREDEKLSEFEIDALFE
jgi:hypothetical protein